MSAQPRRLAVRLARPSAAALVLVFLLGCACRGFTRHPVETPSERPGETVLTRSLNPFILTNLVSRRIVVEIDWVEGTLPSPKAVQALENTLREYCEEGKEVRVVVDDEIPVAAWSPSAGRPGLERLVGRYLDRDPGQWETEELLYVLYAPQSTPWYGEDFSGMSDSIGFERDGRVFLARTVLLFTDRIRRDGLLWVTPARIERATLVHELGHVLGLVSNPSHTQQNHPAHCTRSLCVMNQPGARSKIYNALPAFFAAHIPHEYGDLCRADIETAKRMWAALAADNPGFAEQLRAARSRRESTTAETWRAARQPR